MNRIVAILSVFLLVACSSNQKNPDLQKILNRQMNLPTSGQWILLNNDTTRTLEQNKPKILVYYDSQGCTSCRLRELLVWKSIIQEIENMPYNSDTSKVEFVFVISAKKDKQALKIALQQHKFPYPILCDTEKEFERDNLLPDNELLHCFLLDKENKVKLIGSPLFNEKMWNRYKQEIATINSSLSD